MKYWRELLQTDFVNDLSLEAFVYYARIVKLLKCLCICLYTVSFIVR